MAGYRKLGRTSDQRKAMLRSQVTNLLYHGKIVTTEARAKEVKKIAEGIIALAVKEKDNFETVKVTARILRQRRNLQSLPDLQERQSTISLIQTVLTWRQLQRLFSNS